MTRVEYKAEIFPEVDCFVGLCRELDVSSFGDSPEDRESVTSGSGRGVLGGLRDSWDTH